MKLEITQKGVFTEGREELALGSIVEVPGDTIPGPLVNKCRPVAVAEPGAPTEEDELEEGDGLDGEGAQTEARKGRPPKTRG